MCARAGLLVGWDELAGRALCVRANCDSWTCPTCRQRMAERWAFRAEMGARQILREGDQLDFVTITGHEKLTTFEATEQVWRSAWSALYAALKRHKAALKYMIVPERHKSGRMHVHALWNADVTKRWLKDNARRRGLGYQCDVKPVNTSGGAQKYIVKYVGKDLGEINMPHFRRVRVSEGWADIPKPENEYVALRWEYIGSNGALATVYDECKAKHIDLIDLLTGEKFDDVDLGTIVYA